MTERKYYKRHCHCPSELWRDLRAITRCWTRPGEHRRRPIDKAFQERLMLAVTEVNGCRYCAYAHAKVALAADLSEAEVEAHRGLRPVPGVVRALGRGMSREGGAG